MAIVLVTAIVVSSPSADAASSTSVVTAQVATVTNLDTTGCPPSTRSFNTVLIGPNLSGLCNVTFGSSNGTARLMLFQEDGVNDAMSITTNGDMATSFTGTNGNGRTTMEFPEGEAQGKFVVMQDDGKFIVGGNVVNGGGKADIALTRFNANGSPDTTYGVAATGRVVTTVVPTEMDELWNGILQSDNKLVTIGNIWVNGFNNDCIVLRYNTNGTLDTSFGSGTGMVTYDGNGWDDCRGIAQLRDGRFVTIGNQWDGSSIDTVVARINNDGTMDQSFGTNGVRRIDMTSTNDSENAYQIFPISNDKLLISGQLMAGGTDMNTYIARLNLDGTLDTTYGTSGITQLSWGVGTDDYAGISSFEYDGSGYVGSSLKLSASDTDMVVYRLNAAGALVTTWGSSGKQRHVDAARSTPAYGILAQGDRVMLSGADAGTAPDGNWRIIRYRSSGLDPDFATAGVLTSDWNGKWDFGGPMINARDGQVATAGTVANAAGTTSGMGLMVLAAGGTVPDYGGAAVWGSANSQSLFGACLETRGGVGASGGWTLDANGSCDGIVGENWYPVEDTMTLGAKVLGSTTSGVTNATAGIRFGMKVGSGLPPGHYVAPLVFEVLTPDA